jgi:hypothetical protein
MTGPSKRPDTRLLGSGHVLVPFPRSCARASAESADTVLLSETSSNKKPAPCSRRNLDPRQWVRPGVRTATDFPAGVGLGSIRCRRGAVQHRGIGVEALVVARPPPPAMLPAQL